jgi:hypothetical protein
MACREGAREKKVILNSFVQAFLRNKQQKRLPPMSALGQKRTLDATN